MLDRIYISHLREGSDDCWDGPGFASWSARDQCIRTWEVLPPGRPCAVYTGTSDREVLDSLARGGVDYAYELDSRLLSDAYPPRLA